MSEHIRSRKVKRLQQNRIRSAIVGTGYIADFHAHSILQTNNVDLVAACDSNLKRAESFAKAWGVPRAYSSIEAMVQSTEVDCVHILTPPDSHFNLGKAALELGLHVLLEKPMCTSSAEATELLRVAQQNELYLAINHNFLFADAFERLRGVIRSKALGPIDQVNFNYFFELAQIRQGPMDSWMLRAPGNVVLETAPHLISAVLEIAGDLEIKAVTADREVTLPNGAVVYRRWRVRADAGSTAIDLGMSFGPGFPQRIISVRGLLGSATVDLDADLCVVDQRTSLGPDFDRYRRSIRNEKQIKSQARRVLSNYVLGKLKFPKRGNPYQNSIGKSISAFYSAIEKGDPLDERISGITGRNTIDHCSKIIDAADVDVSVYADNRRPKEISVKPKILVLGAGGFIGRELLRHLLSAGYSVRAMVRGASPSLNVLESDRLEIFRGDIRNELDLRAALQGIEFVYHLAHAQCTSWEEYSSNDIEPTRLVGEACLVARVKRLVYTGTIDSYYAGAKAGVITEETPLDPNIERRNYYARAKAAAEAILTEMYRRRGLPLVVVRPGIVIGRGGNPFHWGVGRFSGDVCELWGKGDNKLPLVLVSDVAAALVRAIEVPDIEGKSFNLIDVPLLTARNYLDELQGLLNYPLRVRPTPILKYYLADLAKWAVKMIVRHPDSKRVPSYRDWESRTQKAYFNCDKSRADLNWSPKSDRQRMVDEGIGIPLESWLDAIR